MSEPKYKPGIDVKVDGLQERGPGRLPLVQFTCMLTGRTRNIVIDAQVEALMDEIRGESDGDKLETQREGAGGAG